MIENHNMAQPNLNKLDISQEIESESSHELMFLATTAMNEMNKITQDANKILIEREKEKTKETENEKRKKRTMNQSRKKRNGVY